jgi:Glycosyltransferases involved in cell wall biogenesis
MKITACLIVKDEAECIRQCLDSLKKVVQQIVVVDTGSTDDTVKIAKRYGAEVYFHEWAEDFSAARNLAIDKAKGDWIIFLDADEYFPEKTVQQVPKLIKKYSADCDAFLTEIANVDENQENKVLDKFYAIRIFHKDPCIRFSGKIHEQLKHSADRQIRLYRVDPQMIQLIHTGYSRERLRQKCERNLRMLLLQLLKNPQDTSLYRYLADAYYGLEDYEQALKYACLDIATGHKEITYATRSYRVWLDILHTKKADFATIEAALQKSIAEFPDLPDFYAEYGLLFLNAKRYDEALPWFLKSLELNESYHGVETSVFKEHILDIYSFLGLIYEKKQDIEKGLAIYQKILQQDRYIVSVFAAFYRIVSQQGDTAHCIAALQEIYDQTHPEDVDFLIANISRIQTDPLAYYVRLRG